jgi:hypothetical protein
LDARYGRATPLEFRIRRAAFLDYDFLRLTKRLERGADPNLSFDYSGSYELFLAAQKGLRAEALKTLVGIDPADAEQALQRYAKELLQLAAQADAARHDYLSRVGGDRTGAARALEQLFSALVRLREFLTATDRHTDFSESEETITENFLANSQKYEVHMTVNATYQVTYPERTKIEEMQELVYLDLVRDILIGATLGDEQRVEGGVKELASFYDLYREAISPPASLSLPYTLVPNGGLGAMAGAANTKRRAEGIKKAINDLKKQHDDELSRDAIGRDTLKEFGESSVPKTDEIRSFEKTFQKDKAASQVISSPPVKEEKDGTTIITIKQSYVAAYDLKEDGDFWKVPAAASTVDVARRTEAVRAFWDDGTLFTAGAPRFNRVLEAFHQDNTGDAMMSQFWGRRESNWPGRALRSAAFWRLGSFRFRFTARPICSSARMPTISNIGKTCSHPIRPSADWPTRWPNSILVRARMRRTRRPR